MFIKKSSKFESRFLFFPKKMKAIGMYTKTLLLAAALLYGMMPAIAQKKRPPANPQRTDFYHLLAQAGLQFTYPTGFREIKAVNNEDFSFDYAMELPGKDFEVWLQIKSQKENWKSYEHARTDEGSEPLANPDSMYLGMGRASALTLTGGHNYLVRNLPADVLARYNADAGKSYLLNLVDAPVTKHYKYALIISLQKNHTGTVIAVFFTNNKDSDFYRDVSRAGHCLKFKNQPPG